MTEDVARKFAEILRGDLMQRPELAAAVRRLRRGMTSPSRILLCHEDRNDAGGSGRRAG